MTTTTTRLQFTHGGHRYKLDGQPVKSVTTLLQVLAKPQLVAWAANESADYAIDHWDDLAAQTPSERRAQIAAAHRRRRDKAAARGTQIHEWADALIRGEPVEVPDQHQAVVNGLAGWWPTSGFEPVHAETAVYAERDFDFRPAYAGRFDMLAHHPRWGLTLLDWKTGKGVYAEYAVQLAGYAAADMIQVPADDGTLTGRLVDEAMPWVDTYAVVHLTGDGPVLHILDQHQRRLADQRWGLVLELNAVPEPEWSQQA